MPVHEYRATEAAATTALADKSTPALAGEVMARFRAKEAAEEDTMRRMVGSSILQSIEESLAEDFVAGENSGKSSDGGFAKKGNIWKEDDGKTFFRLFRSCDLLTLWLAGTT